MTQPRASEDVLPTILIVDDDADDALSLKRLLMKLGVRNAIIPHHGAEEVMKHLRGALAEGPRPGLIFVDVRMPQIDGLSLVAWIRRQKALRDIRIVVVSSADNEHDRHQSTNLGADAYIVKMPTAAVLRELVAKFLPAS